MSISLTVLESPDDGDRSLNVPVATEAAFDAVWLKGAKAVQSEYIPLFQSGIELTPPDKNAVIGELIRLENWLASAPLDAAARNLALERVQRLSETIIALFRKGDQVKIYIG